MIENKKTDLGAFWIDGRSLSVRKSVRYTNGKQIFELEDRKNGKISRVIYTPPDVDPEPAK